MRKGLESGDFEGLFDGNHLYDERRYS